MRQYKFDKPLVESSTPPRSTDVYWIDVDEKTRELLTIKEFDKETNQWSNIAKKPGYFSVTITMEGEGCKLVSDKSNYNVGETVLLTATLEEECEIEELDATWAGGDVNITEIDETHWSFEMPAGDVNVAGFGGEKVGNYITFVTTRSRLILGDFSGIGEVVVKYQYNGTMATRSFNNPSREGVEFTCDPNTTITITGVITFIDFDEKGITSIDLSQASTKLTRLGLESNDLISINAQRFPKLTTFEPYNNANLESIDIRHSALLTQVDFSDLPSLKYIACRATNEDVANEIATAIANTNVNDGVVYLNSADTYYSTIAGAAATKGWTIEQLPA